MRAGPEYIRHGFWKYAQMKYQWRENSLKMYPYYFMKLYHLCHIYNHFFIIFNNIR